MILLIKKRERDKNDRNDFEASSKNRKCYNCDSIEHLTNKCVNFHDFEHVLVDRISKTTISSKIV